MSEGGQKAVRANEEVVPLSRVRELENRVRELERLLGRKTRETEILACCRFRGHQEKIVTKELESGYDETEVQP
jgi:hypothetical protein